MRGVVQMSQSSMGTMSTSGSTQPTQSRPMASRSDAGYRSDTYNTLPSLPPNLWPSSRGAFARAEDGVGVLRRYSQRSADYSTDGDRQYYDDRRYDHSRSALAPCFPLRLLADESEGSAQAELEPAGWLGRCAG